LEPEDGDITDRDVEVKFDESVGRPADAVEEAHQRQEEGHVLDGRIYFAFEKLPNLINGI
jgi:translation elongation factor EF-G